MPTKVLSIVETAYRATIEEQDDTVLWLTHMLKTNGLDMTVLLRANAVNYLVAGQDGTGLHIGDIVLDHAPHLDGDVKGLVDHGVPVLFVQEDLLERGIREDRLIDGVKAIGRSDVAALLDEFEHIWRW
jgi:intracellular sulfur oxidation DsrE/DsrF family protein